MEQDNTKKKKIIIITFIVLSIILIIGLKTGFIIGFNDTPETVKMNVGESINIDDIIKDKESIKSASFSNGDAFKIDENNNIIADKEGTDSLIIVLENDEVIKIPIESNKTNTTERKDQNKTNITEETTSIVISLDSQSANVIGTKEIYEKVVNKVTLNNFYLDNKLTKEMSSSSNKIIIPEKYGYIFKGYYTDKNKKGTLVINELGYLTNNSLNGNIVLYAYYQNDSSYVDLIDANRCTKDSKTTYHITSCQSKDKTDALCNYDIINGKNENGIIERNKLTKDNCGYYTNPFTIKVVNNTSNDKCMQTTEISEGCLISGNIMNNATLMQHNTNYFQNVINKASEFGIKNNIISQVNVPAGNFYFTQSKTYTGVVIGFRSKVKLIGSGEDVTVFLPYGKSNSNYLVNGLTMFSNARYDNEDYTTDAQFTKFTIDGTNARGYTYAAGGKGFHSTYCKRCVFEYITVKNTDGTCFGVDMVIDSKIDHCKAIRCGKNAGTIKGVQTTNPKLIAEAPGASGYGIGTGASDKESLTIKNSSAENCSKFGYFFEHQNRFGSHALEYKADKSKGSIVENCTAKGNLINYGGIRANDVLFVNNVSTTPRAYDVYFTEQSRRIHVSNIKVDLESGFKESRKFNDVLKTDYFYEAVKWAQTRGVSLGEHEKDVLNTNNTNYTVFVDNVYKYSPNTEITRAEAILMLWRSEDRPGSVITVDNGYLVYKKGKSSDKTNIQTGFDDVDVNASYAEAVKWAKQKGIVKGTASKEFSPNNKLIKQHFIYMLFRLDGKQVLTNEKDDANNWAVNMGIIKSATNLDNNITRKEAITMIYRYYQKKGFPYETTTFINQIKNSYK